ncbi:caspase family protein [Archangium lansingense]|uniref:Caspase family protein n=1 Tax=Archangium lansingense TaxID=2995310 RepID=A0ABT3ZV36_9BACT|nr:caspase family protein [Archangium lansinium]MCY1073166.1 caspase family protein [Archangium lansinium]
MTRSLALALVLAAALARAQQPPSPPAEGEAPRVASFALILGVNRSYDRAQKPLRFADDDAARYLDLFRLLGARTYLLARLDDNTRRLHPQAAAEALEPTLPSLRAQVRQLAQDIAQARARGVAAELYVVYAGHGALRDGAGTVSLEDGPLTGTELAREVVEPVGASRVHLIVDACDSYYLAYGRGPGGERRALSGFAVAPGLAGAANVGLLLSTSSARESHEWEGVQAGIFHHEVRSALMGAADADRDGRVSYREVAAFVAQANAAIPNERFRPQVHARPPAGGDVLLDLRPGLGRRLEVEGALGGHYQLEDGNGVRLAEFHSAPGQPVHLIRPGPTDTHFLRRVGEHEQEYRLPAGDGVVVLAALEPRPPQVAWRGAAHEAFTRLFTLPFGPDEVARMTLPPAPRVPSAPSPASPAVTGSDARFEGGVVALVVGGIAFAGVVGTSVHAQGLADKLPPTASQSMVAEQNARIRTANTAMMVLGGVGLGASVLGGVLLLWSGAPATTPVPTVTVGPGAGALSLSGQW